MRLMKLRVETGCNEVGGETMSYVQRITYSYLF